MMYLISYDITSSRERKKISDFLIAEQFLRIQKSVFLAVKETRKIESIIDELQEHLNLNSDDLLIIPVCREDFEKSIFMGNSFDIQETREIEKILFF